MVKKDVMEFPRNDDRGVTVAFYGKEVYGCSYGTFLSKVSFKCSFLSSLFTYPHFFHKMCKSLLFYFSLFYVLHNKEKCV